MSEHEPSEPPRGDKIRRPTPGGPASSAPPGDETIVRPRPARPGPFGDETLVRPRPAPAGPPDDATVVRPKPAPTTPPDDETIVRPRPARPAAGSFDDATVVRPRPRADTAPPPAGEAAAWPEHLAEEGGTLSGFRGELTETAEPYLQTTFEENPFVAAARSLLALVSSLRTTAKHEAVAELQQSLAKEIKRFENRVLQQGISEEQARLASYALCSLLDEAILNTPWGSNSFWWNQTLLVIFHQEAFGGEKFFQFLERLMRRPAQNLDLIELFWLCLDLGFEGKYRLMPQGANQLEQVRTDVYQLIRRIRGDHDSELSIRWRGIQDARNPLVRYVPPWVIASAAGAVLLLIYLGFVLWLNGTSDAVARDLYALGREEPGLAAVAGTLQPPPPPPKAGRFKQILKEEIDRNRVEVVEDRILRIRNSFASGSDIIKPDFLPMLGKIARELEKGGDSALITGHTDDTPIVSAKFPSNFELSASRARHVADILESSASLKRKVKSEGRADYEPLAPNDSAEHKAINRRVDVLVQ